MAPAIAFVAFRLLFSALARACLSDTKPGEALIDLLMTAICLSAALYFYTCRAASNPRHLSRPGWISVARCVIAGLLTGLFSAGYAKAAGMSSAQAGVVWLLTRCAMGPVAEEIVYRGLVYERAQTNWGDTAALIVSSIAFACAHGSLSRAVPALVAGLVLAWLRKQEGGVIAPVYAHIVMNATVYAITAG